MDRMKDGAKKIYITLCKQLGECELKPFNFHCMFEGAIASSLSVLINTNKKNGKERRIVATYNTYMNFNIKRMELSE